MEPSRSIGGNVHVPATRIDELLAAIVRHGNRSVPPITDPKLHLAIVMLALLAQAAAASGTSIVARRSPSKVTIGADSKAIHEGGRTSSICKVHVFKDAVFACSGHVEFGTVVGRFDAHAVIPHAFRAAGNIDLRVRDVAAAVRSDLQEALMVMRWVDRERWERESKGPT